MPGKLAMQLARQKLQTFASYWHSHRYSFLFYSLCFTLIAFPLLATIKFDETLPIVFLAISLGVALGGLKSRHFSHLMLLLLLVIIGVRLIAGAFDLHAIVGLSTAVLISLGFIACIDTVRVAMTSNKVSGELLYAGLSVYMLIGILFAMLHYAIGLEWSDAYSLPAGETLSLRTSMYFSFITQTTLGYGDILPRSEMARGLTMIQGIAGQLYLTVMVARLVGLYASNSGTGSRQ